MRSSLHMIPCGSESKGGKTMHRFRLMEGSVIHIDGFPVAVTREVEVETATDLVKALAAAESPVSRPVLTEADALADLAGTPRPDNPTV